MADPFPASPPILDPPLVGWNEFLVNVPPGQSRHIVATEMTAMSGMPERIKNVSVRREQSFQARREKLWCSKCEGFQLFDPDSSDLRAIQTPLRVMFTCRNCGDGRHLFFLGFEDWSPEYVQAVKIGQWPLFSIDVPPRVQRLIQPHLDFFKKGLRAERTGLGIGALTYYRRIVEHDWQRLIEAIIKVAKQVGAPSPQIETLESAAKQDQFSKAVALAKDALPASLLIEGHNPLTLLYRATSVGMHEETDEWCMSRAGDIREVLTDLAERIQTAVAEKKPLKEALQRLTNLRDDPPRT